MRNRLIAALGAAIGPLCLLAGCASSAGGGAGAGGGSSADAQTEIIGTWRPTAITGYTPPADYPDAFVTAPITFDRAHRLSGSDGCNRFDLGYRLAADGSLSVSEGAMTAIGCANVPNADVASKARRVKVTQDSLLFLDASGRVLGSYERNPT